MEYEGVRVLLCVWWGGRVYMCVDIERGGVCECEE